MTTQSMSFDTIKKMFEDRSIYSASPETLQACLHFLATEGIVNDRIRHVAIIQALTINHIQTAQVIHALNEQNQKTQLLFKVIAIASILIGLAGLLL